MWEHNESICIVLSEAFLNSPSLSRDIINSPLEFEAWNNERDFGSLSYDKKVLKKYREYEMEFVKQVMRKILQMQSGPAVPLDELGNCLSPKWKGPSKF